MRSHDLVKTTIGQPPKLYDPPWRLYPGPMVKRVTAVDCFWPCRSNFFGEEAETISDITLSEVFAVGTVFSKFLDPGYLPSHSKQVLTKEIEC